MPSWWTQSSVDGIASSRSLAIGDPQAAQTP